MSAPAQRRARSVGSAILVALGSLSLAVALVAGWIDRNVFDSREFAARAVMVLDDAGVRRAVAEEVADQLTKSGSSVLVSYRSLLLPLVEDVVGTPAFRSIFRAAVEEAHRTAVSRHAGQAALEMGETLKMLTSTAVVTSPGLADTLEKQASSLLIDAAPVLDRLDLWRVGERVRWADEAAGVLTIALFAGAAIADRDRRRAVLRIGMGTVAAGLAVALVTWIAPRAAAARIRDAALARAVRDVVSRFTTDLVVLGLCAVVIGVVVAAATSATGPPHIARDLRRQLQRAGRWVTTTRAGQVVGGAGLIVLGIVVLGATELALWLLVWASGIVVVYVGMTLVVLGLLGPAPARSRRGLEADVERDGAAVGRSTLRPVAGVLGLVVVLAVVGVGLVALLGNARASARESDTLKCNGSADYCDRRLDQVVLPGSHNSMSAASDPGWLFAENLTGIPTQLEYGVRALLVKSHYGTPTGVDIGGSELVVTDTAAEADNDKQDEVAELSAAAVARAQQLESSVPTPATPSEIYLCHVYCSLGATKLSDTLLHLRRFLDRNPGEVVMLFIGDYVSPADTAAAFEQAKLLDHVWTYDTTKPPPTLREMIDARRTLLVLAEHQGGAPPWYTKGYGIFQDTPYTFATPQQFSCAKNRGPADAPLFELNHFITNSEPPSVTEARAVNAYDVLMPRAEQCMQERGLLPNIVAVDFYDQGDLLRVAQDLNERALNQREPSDATTTSVG